MRGVAYALRVCFWKLSQTLFKPTPNRKERTVQRDSGPLVRVMSRDALDTSQVLPVDVGRPVAPSIPAPPLVGRPSVRGKFFFAGDQKLYLRGVTYGTFRPLADGSEVPRPGGCSTPPRVTTCG